MLVEKNNVKELAICIQSLLNNQEAARLMGVRGRRRLRQEFSLSKMTREHLALYQRCLNAAEAQQHNDALLAN